MLKTVMKRYSFCSFIVILLDLIIKHLLHGLFGQYVWNIDLRSDIDLGQALGQYHFLGQYFTHIDLKAMQ